MSTMPRTKISRDKFGDKEVIWLPDLHTIDEIMNEISLPVLVKVVDGYMINEIECLESNTILSIHGHRRMKKFIAIDQQERHMKIPVTCKYEAMVRPNVTIPLCKTAGDVCRQPKIPKFITNEIEFRSYDRKFPALATFLVKSADKTGTLSAVCLTEKGYETRLPAPTNGHFRETVHPDDRNKRYLMKDLVNRDLPLSVEFQPHSRDSNIYSPRMGTVRLKDLTVNDVVYATTYENGRRLLITFSRALNIKLQIGQIMVEADGDVYSTIAEPTEDEMDDEVLEHALHLDPYNGDYINVDYEDVLLQLGAENYKKLSSIDHSSSNEQAAAVVRQVREIKAPTPPGRDWNTPKKPPRVPPRKRSEENNSKCSIEKPTPSDDDRFKTIQTLQSSIKNKYVTAPKLPPKLPPRLPPKLPPVIRPKSTSNFPENGPKSAPAAVAPTQRRCSQDTENWAIFPELLEQATSVGSPQSDQIARRPPLPAPRNEGIHVQERVNGIQPDGYRKMAPISRDIGMVAGNSTDNKAFKHIPFDKSIHASSSADTMAPNQAYEKIAVHRQTSKPMDTTLMAQKSAITPLNQRYEEVTFHIETSPVETALTSTKSAQAKSPSLLSNLPIDTTLISTNHPQVREPSGEYEEVLVPGEILPIDTTLMSSKTTTTERGTEYEEIYPSEEAALFSRGPSQFDIQAPISSTVVNEEPKKKDDVAHRIKQSLNSHDQISDDGETSVDIEATINGDQMSIDLVLKKLAGEDMDGICNILDKLQLGEFKENFISNQIDGELLIDIKDEDLVSDLEMTLFQARKLSLYMRGWKPDEERSDYHEQIQNEGHVPQTSEEETDKPVEAWLVEEVCKRMLSIKLSSFADFCKENQVNGSLLKGILDHDVIDSIRTDHNIKFSRIEERKLINYVTKGWRPK